MTEQELQSFLTKHGYAQCWDELKSTLLHEVRLTANPTKQDDSRSGSTKQGGRPDLANFEKWPKYKIRNSPGVHNTSKPMTFLMQLNCRDIKSLTSCDVFPESGLLSFFVGVEQNQLVCDTHEIPIGRVVYSNRPHFELERVEFPRNLYYLNQLSPANLKMEQSVSVSEETFALWTDDFQEYYRHEMCRHGCHKIFAHPEVRESDIFEEHSHFDYDSDWISLLEFDLDELEVLDSGFLCFLIDRDDLKMMNFQNTLCLHKQK